MSYATDTDLSHLIAPPRPADTGDVTQDNALRCRARTPALLSRAPLPLRRGHEELQDWDRLLTALTARLRATVRPSPTTDASTGSVRRIQEVVLECAADLDLLHRALCAENVRRHWLEASFADQAPRART